MPIHLPPLSRRRFLARVAAAAAGLALGPELLAADRRTDEDSWALLSDIHIAADPAAVARKVNMTDHLTRVTREVLALPNRPAGLFVVGDCAFNSGEVADYAHVAGLLEPIRKDQTPVHLALGNHDNRDRFWQALHDEKAAKRPVADRQTALIRTPRANWFVLDSLEKTLSTPGILGQEQLDWLGKALDANADKPALVLVHHNPGAFATIGGLKDSEALFGVIR
ncbi:MAG TPA: metallophosphoesterase, partial [Candidatus Acidoferrum sp.]|nr:metallophosphoesterase [Candidatus Acidoferrum sp.]